jgi:hypothetical protein
MAKAVRRVLSEDVRMAKAVRRVLSEDVRMAKAVRRVLSGDLCFSMERKEEDLKVTSSGVDDF